MSNTAIISHLDYVTVNRNKAFDSLSQSIEDAVQSNT